MLFTKILTLLVLSAQPQPELVSAAPPVVSEVMEQPTSTGLATALAAVLA